MAAATAAASKTKRSPGRPKMSAEAKAKAAKARQAAKAKEAKSTKAKAAKTAKAKTTKAKAAKTSKAAGKVVKIEPKRRGRPPLSAEEKAKRAAERKTAKGQKAATAKKGPGRPPKAKTATKATTTKRGPGRPKMSAAKKIEASQERKVRAAKAKKAMANRTTAIKKKFGKLEVYSALAESNDLEMVQVRKIFEDLQNLAERHLKKNGCGEFEIPNIAKLVRREKKATKAKKNVPCPFRPGETYDIKAKPASLTVKSMPTAGMKKLITG